jgi:signal transduction histidine kinase
MKRPRLAPRLTGRWRALPPRTIRLRLTAIYAGLFLACGAALLAINYGLVSGQLTSHYFKNISVGQEQLFISQQGTESSGGSSVKHVSGTTSAPAGRAGGGSAVGGGVGAGPTQITGNGVVKGIGFPSKVVQATSIAASNAAHGTLLIESGIALAIMALLAAGLGWVIAGRALRPLRAITATARDISASNLHRRLALTGPDDELRQLGHTFDALLERLESAFTAQRQFAANVSHELRTPLTYERTLIEVALADPDASNDRLRAVLYQLLTAGEHQERLIEALLVLSRSQRGLDHGEPVDLAAVAAHTLERADTYGLAVERSLGPARTNGDPRLIERLAANLIANAVQYNQPAGRIDVTTRTTNDRAVLRVTNTGQTIPPEELNRLFEPFQRIDGARTSTTDGLGLGLSIVKAIADAHAATIITELPEHGGLSIEIAFPVPQRTQPALPIRHEVNRSTAPLLQGRGAN